MIRFDTRILEEIVAPEDLKDVLRTLKNRGAIESFRVTVETTTIQMTKNAEIVDLIKQASEPKPNPRPYVANKVTKHKK
jgi:uncharacterized protein involved in exopolysaccharide biosynthesis